MKFVIASIIAAASAVKLGDADAFFNEPTWRETFPSAAGLVQIGSSACNSAERHFGITCENNLVQFATGMNGDEDLGQDIIMKGDKFHYQQDLAQWTPVVVASSAALPVCHGNNGPDGVNCARPICNGTNGPLDGHSGTPCTREEPAAIPHYNTDPLAGRPYQTTGDIAVTSSGTAPANAAGASAGNAEGGLPPMASGSRN